MSFNQTIAVQTNPLYIDTNQATKLRTFFQALGVDNSNISFAPATPESGSPDPSTLYTVNYTLNLQLGDTRYGYYKAWSIPVIDGDVSKFAQRFKIIRDQYMDHLQRSIFMGLTQDIDGYNAGTFTPPDGQDLVTYLRSTMQLVLDTFPAVDV